jgi:hypothetical protein
MQCYIGLMEYWIGNLVARYRGTVHTQVALALEEIAVAIECDGFGFFGYLVTYCNHATVIANDGQSGWFSVHRDAETFVRNSADYDTTDRADGLSSDHD